ncbi:hypothetical protein [Streptomyces luteolus]|uniref:Uncharacterized protein n=1 Tax=Streptomyces luteolus TaxID=3043615 RepID=A0ABT6T8B3_9ACTN|nr:hypothetical protein [Streptomyces sp. B-S-A12]MDI3423087.1 hypothetical protein [Streptomyces sp. B-S-A12]
MAVVFGLGPEDAVPHAFPGVGCGAVALHPRIDVFFAVMLVWPEREAVEGCNEHVLVQAVFTKNDLGGRRIRQQLGGDGQARFRAAVERSSDGVDECYATLSPAECTELRLGALLQDLRPVCVRAALMRQGDAGQVHATGRHVRARFAIEVALHRHGQ